MKLNTLWPACKCSWINRENMKDLVVIHRKCADQYHGIQAYPRMRGTTPEQTILAALPSLLLNVQFENTPYQKRADGLLHQRYAADRIKSGVIATL